MPDLTHIQHTHGYFSIVSLLSCVTAAAVPFYRVAFSWDIESNHIGLNGHEHTTAAVPSQQAMQAKTVFGMATLLIICIAWRVPQGSFSL